MEHKDYLKAALKEAQKSQNEVPVGALIVVNNKIIAKAHNKKEAQNDPTAHAEMIVIREASQKLESWRLENAILYVTLEPCPMCASAILYSRISQVVFGAYDFLYGAFGSVINIPDYLNYKPKVLGGIMEKECSDLMKCFFQKQREKDVF